MNKRKEHIRYMAAVRQPHNALDCFQPQSSYSCMDDEDFDKEQIQKFAAYKLQKINDVSSYRSGGGGGGGYRFTCRGFNRLT